MREENLAEQFRVLYETENLTEEEFAHYGVKGMKWGVRRSRQQLEAARERRSGGNATLTMKKRPDASNLVVSSKPAKKKKSTAKLELNDETKMRNAINKMRLEREYESLRPTAKTMGKKLVNDLFHETLPNSVKKAVEAKMTQEFKKMMGVVGEPKKK